MTQIRGYETRVFSDYFIYSVMKRGVTFTTSDELTNIVRACYIVNTKDDNNRERKPMYFNNPINQEWHNSYRRDFNKVL